MGSFSNQNPWAPYDTYRDCSQGICTLYCPQWCYIIFPPPPPFNLSDQSDSSTDFSPLIIAVIGILASAFILITYYTIISKYCTRRGTANVRAVDSAENLEQVNSEPSSNGLDEVSIKSITVCKYKKGDGLVEGTDCSVCLSEFEENESLRLLPKCKHAFHLPCIDTWLKSNSSCPLCRSNIAYTNENQPPQRVNVSAHEYQQRGSDAILVVEDLESSVRQEAVVVEIENHEVLDPKIQSFEDGCLSIGRSVSLNSCSCHGQLSVADILREDEEEEEEEEEEVGLDMEIGCSKGTEIGGEDWKCNERSGIVFDLGMKRSVSTGRFVFTKYGKGKNFIIPN